MYVTPIDKAAETDRVYASLFFERMWIRGFGGGTPASNLARLKKELAVPKYTNTIPPKEGVCESILRLYEEGANIFLLTASPHILSDPCLRRYGILHCFKSVYSTDDFGLSKSNPEIYHALCKKEGIAVEDTAFYDDNVIAVKTAREAGLFTVGVYDASSDEDKEEIKNSASLYIDSFKQLL